MANMHWGGQYAIKISSVAAGGIARYWSFEQILLHISSMLILCQLPWKVCFLVAIHCLGDLSRLYKRAIIQPFDIVKDSVTMAVNLIASHACFSLVADVEEDGKTGISKNAVIPRFGSRVC